MNQRKAGIVLSYLAQGINIISAFIYTPIMLRLLGQSEYGLYQLAASVVANLSLLSFGFSSSYARFYSRFKVKREEKEIARLNGLFMTIFMIIACICMLCGMVMILNIRVLFSNGLTMHEYKTAQRLMILMVFNLSMTFPTSVFDSYITVHEKFVFQRLVSLMQAVFNPFLTLPLLLTGHGSVSMVLVSTFLTIVKLVVNGWYSRKKLHIRFIFKGFRWNLIKEMWIFTFFIFINMIVDQINWSVDKFLLGRFAGTAAVAVYGVGSQVNSLYIQMSSSISNVFIPKVNTMVAESEDNTALTKLFIKVGRVQFIILAFIISGFIFLGQPFIELWAGKEYGDSYRIAILLMLPVSIPLIQNLGVEIQKAKNKHQVRSAVYLCIAVSNIFISIPCIHRWGAKGAAFGTALTLLLGNGAFMNWYYHKKIGINILWFWKNILKFVPALIVPSLVGICFMKNIRSDIVSFTLSCGLYCIVYAVSMYLFGLDKEEKIMIKKCVRRK